MRVWVLWTTVVLAALAIELSPLGTFRVGDLAVDHTAAIGTQLSALEVDVGRGVPGSPGSGPGLCAPPAPTPQGSGGPYDPYGYVPADCPGFPLGYSVLDLDLTGGDVTIDGLPEGSPGQVLFLLNEGGANLYLYNNVYSTEWPFLLPGYHQQWVTLTESSVAILKFGPTRYGENYWQVIALSDSALVMPRDLSPGSAYRASVSACGSGASMISGGAYSGVLQGGVDATSCLLTIHPSNASGTLNCLFTSESGVPIASDGWTLVDVGPPISLQTTLSGSDIGSATVHFLCNLVGG